MPDLPVVGDAPAHAAESGFSGFKNALTKKYGPAPGWVYVGIAGVAGYMLFLRGGKAASDGGTGFDTSAGDGGTGAGGLPPLPEPPATTGNIDNPPDSLPPQPSAVGPQQPSIPVGPQPEPPNSFGPPPYGPPTGIGGVGGGPLFDPGSEPAPPSPQTEPTNPYAPPSGAPSQAQTYVPGTTTYSAVTYPPTVTPSVFDTSPPGAQPPATYYVDPSYTAPTLEPQSVIPTISRT